MKKILVIAGAVILIVICVFLFKKHQNSKNPSNSTIGFATSTTAQGNPNQPITATQNPGVQSVSTTTVAPDIIIYKTVRDYSGLAWVYLSSDKTQVISYMDPKDILNQLPVKLDNGYYSGVLNMNTAFVNIKIAAYAKMSHPLTPKQLFSLIVNSSPFSEMYDCGSKTNLDTTSINTLIDSNKLSSQCTKVI